MVQDVEHWKKKWIEWWTKWPDGKFPTNTYAVKAKSDLRTGKATIEHYEGHLEAALELAKDDEEEGISDECKLAAD